MFTWSCDLVIFPKVNQGSLDNTHFLLLGGHTYKPFCSSLLLGKGLPWLTVCLFWIPLIWIIFGYQRQSMLLPKLDSGSNLAHGPVQCYMAPKLTGWHVESKIIDWNILYLFSFIIWNWLIFTILCWHTFALPPPPPPKKIKSKIIDVYIQKFHIR